MTSRDFHIVTVGSDLGMIDCLFDPIERATGFTFSHVLDPALDRASVRDRINRRFFFMREDIRMKMPAPNEELLAELEQPGIPTIHNMIMGDRVVRLLHYEDALAYASHLARRIHDLLVETRPSLIIGAFDRLHGGITMAVARKLDIPWFALNFTTIPPGLTGFCTTMSPDSSFSCVPMSSAALRDLAERIVTDFQAKRLQVPVYLSANSVVSIIKRLPRHFRVFLRSVTQKTDKYTHHSVRYLIREYLRKRINLLRLPTRTLLNAPLSQPYVFFGLHMQPEASIDVWAPFFSNQFGVIEAIARSTPPTHRILVKLHKSDADNYSRRQLKQLQKLPGVQLVSPYANSRQLIENAALVFGIQGSIALEAALLGRPVLLFGDSGFVELPSVEKVRSMTDLPAQVRAKLAEAPPDREAIIRGLMAYLSGYAPGCYNDWEKRPSKSEVAALAEQFRGLREFVERQAPWLVQKR